MSYRTSDVAPIAATTVAVLVLVLVAAIAVLGFIAALLLAALVLGFIAATATTAAAVAAYALVTAAAPPLSIPPLASKSRSTRQEPRELLLKASPGSPSNSSTPSSSYRTRNQPIRRLLVHGSPVSRRDDNHRKPLAVLLWGAAVLLRLLDQDQHLEVAAHFHPAGGSSGWRRAQASCLANSVASAAAALSACS